MKKRKERAFSRAMHEERSSIQIRWGEVRLAALAAVAFGATVAVVLPGMWSLMPFPQPAPVETVALIGFLFGFLLRRMWVLALPFTVLIVLTPPQSGFAGSIIAFLALWPSAAAGALLGIGLGRWLKRRMLRRTIRAARRPVRVKPPDGADAPIHATRREPVHAGTGR